MIFERRGLLVQISRDGEVGVFDPAGDLPFGSEGGDSVCLAGEPAFDGCCGDRVCAPGDEAVRQAIHGALWLKFVNIEADRQQAEIDSW